MWNVSGKTLFGVSALLCLISGCSKAHPEFHEIASFGAKLSLDNTSFEIDDSGDHFILSGQCAVQGDSQIHVRHAESSWIYPPIACVNGGFSSEIDAGPLLLDDANPRATLIVSTDGAPELAVSVDYNYCSVSRRTNSPFANSGETGMDGLSVNSAFVICNPDHLSHLAADSALWDKIFRIKADLELSPATGYVHAPIGDRTTPFTGRFDGEGHTLKNLTYVDPLNDSVHSMAGLFGVIGPAGLVQRVRLTDVAVAGSYSVGALVGVNQGTVSRSSSSGAVNGTELWVGGLIGSNSGNVRDSYSTTIVASTNRIFGAFIGIQTGGTVERSYAAGHVFGANTSDGFQSNFIGYMNGAAAKAQDSFATGDIFNTHLGPQAGSIGFVIGQFSNGTIANVHHNQDASCMAAIACTVYGAAQPLSSFFSPLNPPLASWDFTGIWIERPGALPELR